MSARRPVETGLCFLVFLFAIAARFYGLDRLSLWSDELWVVMASTSGSLTDMLTQIYNNDNHPPGYYLLSRYSQALLGSSDFAIRLPSALAGIALVVSVWHIGKHYFSAAAGLLAAALVAGSYQAIYYSQEARPNIFVALFALWALQAFWQVAWYGDGSRHNALRFTLAATAAMYFHYAGLVFVLCLLPVYALLCLWLWRREHTSAFLQRGLSLLLPALLLFAPWLPGMIHDLTNSPPEYWQRTPGWHTLDETFWFLFGPDNVRVWFYQAMALLALAYLASGVYCRFKYASRVTTAPDTLAFIALLLVMSVLPLALFFVKSQVSQSAYNHRHFVFVIPFMALVAGFLLSLLCKRLGETAQQAAVAAIVMLVLLYSFFANNGRALYSANHFKQEYRESAQVVAGDATFLARADGALIANLPFFDHYLKRFTQARQSDVIYETENDFPAVQALLAKNRAGVFYYLEAPLIPGANAMVTEQDQNLAQHYHVECRTRFARTQVLRFSVQTPAPVSWEALPACP